MALFNRTKLLGEHENVMIYDGKGSACGQHVAEMAGWKGDSDLKRLEAISRLLDGDITVTAKRALWAMTLIGTASGLMLVGCVKAQREPYPLIKVTAIPTRVAFKTYPVEDGLNGKRRVSPAQLQWLSTIASSPAYRQRIRELRYADKWNSGWPVRHPLVVFDSTGWVLGESCNTAFDPSDRGLYVTPDCEGFSPPPLRQR